MRERGEMKRVWYEGPQVSGVGDLTSELPFITKLIKKKSTPSHSDSIGESRSHSSDSESSRNGTGTPQQKQLYSTSSILPPLWAGQDVRRWRVVCVSVQVGRVVVYCGEGGKEGGELGCRDIDSCQVMAVVVYHTEAKSCSFTRYICM